MREWRRVPADTLCGNCSSMIQKNDPAIFVKLETMKRELVRCQACVGLAPPDLPALTERGSSTKPMHAIKRTALGMTRARVASEMDYTARRVGERE